MRARQLKNDKHTSCACQVIKHNLNESKIYATYHNMKYRCYTKTCYAYKNYGGKGVIICDEWLSDFMNFYSWAVNNGYDESLTIDRIDEDGNYEPSNCQWITKSENTRKANIKRGERNNEI